MPELINESYEMVELATIRPHPENPRKGDTQAIRSSIDQNGFYGAVVVQKSTGYILVGNHRWLAGREAGMEKIPVLWVDVDDSEALRILVADNRTSDLGEYEDKLLREILTRLSETDAGLEGTGYSDEDLTKMLPKEVEQPEYEFTEQLLEEHQYLVLYFDNSIDWHAACEVFGVKPSAALDSRKGYRRQGTGRVIRGADVLKKIEGGS